MTTIAFIGLGHMGSGMAANLAKAGHDVAAFDISEEALDAAKSNGCRIAESGADAVKDAEAVVTMLPAGKHVRAVYADDVFDHAEPGTLLLDCSTIDVATARDVTAQATAKGFAMVDAPVSGGIAAAVGGTLTFMVGGTESAFDRAKPILEQMGKAVIYAGDAGSGQAAKICNNMLLGATMIATCETFNLAQSLGLDPQVFYDISSQASGQSWSMTSYCPVPGVGPETPADHNYEGGFASPLMLKDLKLAMEAADEGDTRTPMGAKARSLYEQYVKNGGEKEDFSGIIKFLETSSTD